MIVASLPHMSLTDIEFYQLHLKTRLTDLKFMKPYMVMNDGDQLTLKLVDDKIVEIEVERVLIDNWLKRNIAS